MAETPDVQINLSNYLTEKAAGTTKIVKINGAPHYSIRKFDINTGAPTPALVRVSKESIAALKTQSQLNIENFQRDIATFDAIIADIDSAQEIMP